MDIETVLLGVGLVLFEKSAPNDIYIKTALLETGPVLLRKKVTNCIDIGTARQ